jgi:small subunit ribosomal protein S8
MISHPLSNLVATIRNGYMAKKNVVTFPFSNIADNVLSVIKSEGYISSYAKIFARNGLYFFNIHLKYKNDAPSISFISVVSKPSKRIYSKFYSISKVHNGLGIVIVSTNKGIMTGQCAAENKVGGELLIKVF